MWAGMPAFGASSYVPAITLERKLFIRERNDGCYLVITYLIYKLVEELLLAVVSSIGIAAFVWGGIGLQGNFGFFWVQYILTLSIGITLAYFVGSLAPTIDVANAALPAYVVTLLFFAGFLIPRTKIPVRSSFLLFVESLSFSLYPVSTFETSKFLYEKH